MSDSETSFRAHVRLSSQNRAPLYHQIFLILRSKIFDGEYRPGALLPGEREVEEMFSVSRITAVRALNELALAGLVVRERGRGTRVQFVGSGTVTRGPLGGVALPAPITAGTIESSVNLPDSGTAEVTVYEFEYVAAPPQIAEALHLPPGTPVQYATRVWRFDDLPFIHMTDYIPEDIGRHWTRRDLEQQPLRDLLLQRVKAALVHERITATLADVTRAERLQVSVGSALLKVMRTRTDSKGRPVHYTISFCAPDRYQYEVILPHAAPSSRASARRKRSNSGKKNG
jgi:GntR family transcriptional regulator